jgi:Cu-Zn family superoxide dismutase
MTRLLVLAALLATTACIDGGANAATGAGPAEANSANADIKDAGGVTVARATATEVDGGISIVVNATGVSAGTHGVHVHTVGRCDAPDFTTAGGHWNPGSTMHGVENPHGPHAGDMPNLIVGADGHGHLAIKLPAGTLDGMLDADGAALVIHAGPDDLKTDPAGNSGARIACGVFQRA